LTAIDVRPAADLDEFRAALGAIGHFFGWEPSEEDSERFSKLLPIKRMLVATDGKAIVAGAGSFPFEMTVPGGMVPTGGVTVVGVLPTHRRRGILTSMMRRQLDDTRAGGEPLAALWASEPAIYGRFGYGLASFTGEIDVPKAAAALALAEGPRGQVRVVTAEDALESFPALYDAVRAERPGMMSRTRDWWEHRRLRDQSREQGGPLIRAVLDLEGAPAGYMLYRVNQKFESWGTVGHVAVLEALGTSPAATREIWRYLFEFDWTSRIEAGRLPADHDLLLLAADPNALKFTLTDGLWVRLVDLPAALAARSYAGDDPIVFDVSDAFLPDNEGRWRLAGGQAKRTDEQADLLLDVTALGSTYLGGVSFAELLRAGRVEELREGAAARADALFRTDRAPWCAEIF
jgi:predicted acetyltransferase